MRVNDLVTMCRRHPVEVLGDGYRGSIRETVGTLVFWGAGVYASMWAARWYTLRTLEKRGILPAEGARRSFLRRFYP